MAQDSLSKHNTLQDMLRPDQVAETLQVSKKLVLQLFHRGELPGKRVGKKQVRFRVDDVRRFMAENSNVGGAA